MSYPLQTAFFYSKIVFLYFFVMALLLLPVATKYFKKTEVLGVSEVISESRTDGIPVRIKVPRIGLDVSVIPGSYSKEAWDLSPNAALFAEMTDLPNPDTGNTLIYGHNTKAVLGSTAKLTKGDMLFVFTNNTHIYTYTYTGDQIVTPQDTSIFSYTGRSQVTLLTCNGFFDTKRRLMFFRFEGVV